MRKVLSPGFTQRALKSQEPIIQKYVGLLIERLREQTNGKVDGAVVDVVPVSSYGSVSTSAISKSHYPFVI